MKAITLWQPWAWLIARGDKRVENRSWRPPQSLIGQRIAVHAGKRVDKSAIAHLRDLGIALPAAYPLGMVVATATLREARRIERIPRGELTLWHSGPWCWELEDVEALRPEPAMGHQGLWNWERRP